MKPHLGLVLALLVCASAQGQSTSVLSGKVLGPSQTVVHGELGWPGLGLSLWHGAAPRLDVGGKVSLLYGYEGIPQLAGVPGVKLQGLLRLGLLERNRLNLGLKLAPGVFSYFWRGGSEFGLTLPLEVSLGFAASPNLMLSGGMDVPIFVVFGPYAGMVVPLRMGMGVEYALDPSLSLTASLRAGPSAVTYPYYSYPSPGGVCFDRWGRAYACAGAPAATAELLVGLSYRL